MNSALRGPSAKCTVNRSLVELRGSRLTRGNSSSDAACVAAPRGRVVLVDELDTGGSKTRRAERGLFTSAAPYFAALAGSTEKAERQ